MPRISTTLAFIVPLIAIFLVIRSFDNVVARLQLSSWPFALHPEQNTEDSTNEQVHLQHPLSGIISDTAQAHKEQESAQCEQASGEFVRRIVAVGDLHGDIGNAYKVLHKAGVVDEEGNWSGGVDFFVQTGDIIDR
jgi:hypothetical protein